MARTAYMKLPLESRRDAAPTSAVFSGLGGNKPVRIVRTTFRSSKEGFARSSSPLLEETAPGLRNSNDGLVPYLTRTLAEEASSKSSSPWAHDSRNQRIRALISPF